MCAVCVGQYVVHDVVDNCRDATKHCDETANEMKQSLVFKHDKR